MRNQKVSFRREDGQALVELALAIPLLLFVLFAIIDFGLAINNYNADTNLANVGAREAAVIGAATTATCSGTTETSIYDYITCQARVTGAPTPSTVCVRDEGPSTGYVAGDAIKVQVASAFNWLQIITGGDGRIAGISGLASTLSASATMRIEQTATTPTFFTNSPTRTCSS